MAIVVVGGIFTDLVSNASRLPKLGETLRGKHFSEGYGGKGANQCIVAARLGAKTAMVGKVGDDTFGRKYLKNFEDNFVNADHVGVSLDEPSGVATIWVTEKGENAIIYFAGANLMLTEQDVLAAEKLIASAKIMMCQLEINPEVTAAAMKLAKKHKVFTILNAAPGMAILPADTLDNTDLLCVNQTEAEIVTGIDVTCVQDAERAASELVSRGFRLVIVTLGSNGAVYLKKGQPNVVHVPARKVQAVDTTGAGDAFLGALAFYLANIPTLSLQETIERANEIATRSVLALGTQTSFPLKHELPDDLFKL